MIHINGNRKKVKEVLELAPIGPTKNLLWAAATCQDHACLQCSFVRSINHQNNSINFWHDIFVQLDVPKCRKTKFKLQKNVEDSFGSSVDNNTETLNLYALVSLPLWSFLYHSLISFSQVSLPKITLLHSLPKVNSPYLLIIFTLSLSPPSLIKLYLLNN